MTGLVQSVMSKRFTVTCATRIWMSLPFRAAM